MITLRRLLTLLVLSGQLGLCSCQWLEEPIDSRVAMASDEDADGFAAEGGEKQLVPASSPPSARKAASRSAARSEDNLTCFLCQLPLQQSKADTFLDLQLHEDCKLAVRAHWRLLTPAERDLDLAFCKSHPDAWRDPILVLISPDGKRPIKEHKAKLTHLTGFHEEAKNKEQILLTKNRFCKFQVFWGECDNESEASESWARRYDESESSHRNSDDEAQVRVRGNESITERSGRLMIKDIPNKRKGRGGDSGEDDDTGRRRKRGRDDGRSSGSTRRRRERRDTPPRDRDARTQTSKSAAAASTVVPSVRSPGHRRTAGVNKVEKPAAKSDRRRVNGKSSQGGKKGGKASALADIINCSDEEGKEDHTMSYLAALKDFETQIDLIVKASVQKNWCAARLSQRASDMDAEQLKRLGKKEDPKQIIKTIGEKVTTLKNMMKELEDLEDHQVDDFRARLKQVVKDLRTQETSAESLLESCSFLKRQAGGKKGSGTWQTTTRNGNGRPSSREQAGVRSLLLQQWK
jgi:hypothetical protein